MVEPEIAERMTETQLIEAQPPYRPIRQLRRIKGVHKLLYNHLGLPLEASEAAIRSLKYVWNPTQVRLRERLAGDLPDSADDAVLNRDGYLKLASDQFDMLSAALSSCGRALEDSVSSGAIDKARSAGPKEFLVSVIRDEEAFQYDGVMELALSRPIVRLASKYLASIPMLSSVRLWWSPPNASAVDSQLYHCDREDRRQLKVLINITATTQKNGPFTIIPAEASERIKTAVKYDYKDYRLTDEAVHAVEDQVQEIAMTGPPGSASCVDTSRCLHYGSRHNTEPRLLLMLQYTSCLAPNVSLPLWLPGLSARPIALDDLQRLVLGLATA